MTDDRRYMTFEQRAVDDPRYCDPNFGVGRRARKNDDVCVVCEGAGSVTYGPSATTGEFNTVTCHRCNGVGKV